MIADRRRRWFALLSLLFAGALVLAACGGGDEEAEPSGESEEGEHAEGAVHTTLKEWSIAPGEGATFHAAAGEVTFEAHNDGSAPHELVVLRTDLAPDALPVEGGKVDEDAEGIEEIGEIEEFPGGEIEVGTFDLQAGNYVLICNIAGHYEQGMYAAFTVE